MSVRLCEAEGCPGRSPDETALPVLSRIAAWRRTRDVWRERRRYRRDLRRLLQVGAYMLEDIGLTPDEAEREAAKPFWRE